MDERLVRFLDKKGVFEILCVIPIDGRSFSELRDRVRVSKRTLTDRLKEGEELDLWDRRPSHRDDDARFAYMLTERGQHLQVILAYHNVPSLLAELRLKEQQFDQRTETIKTRLENHGIEELLDLYQEEFTTD